MLPKFYLWDHLGKFWQIWTFRITRSQMILILKEGDNLPFKVKPPLTRNHLPMPTPSLTVTCRIHCIPLQKNRQYNLLRFNPLWPHCLSGARLGSQPPDIRTRSSKGLHFNRRGYQHNLEKVLVRPTLERWEALNSKIKRFTQPSCTVRQFMSPIGLLTATEKQVPYGCLHMRPKSGT